MVVWLGCWSVIDWRDRGGSRKLVWVVYLMSVLERLEGNKLGKLSTQYLRMSAEMVHHTVRCLLIFREITALIKATRSGRVHEEVWRSSQLNNESPRSLSGAFSVACRVAILKCNVLDVREWILDLVTSRVVVDVVGDAAFLGRIEDYEVHGTLSNATP